MAQRALTPGNAAYCSECGAETLPDAVTCGRCGAAFEGSVQALLCPICNSINPAEARECATCRYYSETTEWDECDQCARSPREDYWTPREGEK